MSLLPEIEGPCRRCRAHPATVRYGTSVMEVMHGDYRVLCECCSLAEGLRQCEEAAARIPELRAKLTAACPDQPRLNQDLVGENDRLRQELERVWMMAHAFVCLRNYKNKAVNDPLVHADGSKCHYPRPEMLG